MMWAEDWNKYNVNINYGDNYVASQSLVGVAPTHPKIDKTELIAGRFINEIDMKEQRKNVVLSRSQAKELSKDYRFAGGQERKDQQPQLPGGGNL